MLRKMARYDPVEAIESMRRRQQAASARFVQRLQAAHGSHPPAAPTRPDDGAATWKVQI